MRKPKPASPDWQNPLESGLYIVATPIGNARDVSLRALDVLRDCDAILAEDTRTTARLLAIHGISRPLIIYNDRNAPRARPQIVQRLEKGERLALVSDAGTPLVSDPGFKLVREARVAGTKVHAIPGASAILAALVLSGLPSNRFLFVGFLPAAHEARRTALDELKTLQSSLIFFEAATRLKDSLEDMHSVLGVRDAAVARELTKVHENIHRDSLERLVAFYRSSSAPRGEVTVVVGPPQVEEPDFSRVDALLEKALPFMPLRASVELVSEALNLPRRVVYARALLLKGACNDDI